MVIFNTYTYRYNFILDKMPIETNRAMRIKNLTNLASILGQVVVVVVVVFLPQVLSIKLLSQLEHPGPGSRSSIEY